MIAGPEEIVIDFYRPLDATREKEHSHGD